MSFIKRLGQTLKIASDWNQKRLQAERRGSEIAESKRVAQMEDKLFEEESAKREAAFAETFPDESARLEAFQRFAPNFPLLDRNGPTMRKFAIQEWWKLEGSRE